MKTQSEVLQIFTPQKPLLLGTYQLTRLVFFGS
jgi:hypothetical protein